MNITITINDEDILGILSDIAKRNNMTIEQYASGIVESWARSHLRNYYIKLTKNIPLSELKNKLGNYSSLKNMR